MKWKVRQHLEMRKKNIALEFETWIGYYIAEVRSAQCMRLKVRVNSSVLKKKERKKGN